MTFSTLSGYFVEVIALCIIVKQDFTLRVNFEPALLILGDASKVPELHPKDFYEMKDLNTIEASLNITLTPTPNEVG